MRRAAPRAGDLSEAPAVHTAEPARDLRAVLHLLSLSLPGSGRAIMPLLLTNARRRTFRLWALEAPAIRLRNCVVWTVRPAEAGAQHQ